MIEKEQQPRKTTECRNNTQLVETTTAHVQLRSGKPPTTVRLLYTHFEVNLATSPRQAMALIPPGPRTYTFRVAKNAAQ